MNEEITYINKNGSNKIDIASEPVELLIVDKPILLVWGISSTRHQYSRPFAIIEYLSQEFQNEFKEISNYLSLNPLKESLGYLEQVFKKFSNGEYSVSKKIATDTIENGRFKDYQILYPTMVDVEKETELVQSYNEWSKSQENNSFEIIDKTSDFIVHLWSNIIALHNKTQEFENEVNYYELQIKNNSFPYCLLLSHNFENEDSNKFFLLESASKLQAYKNLNVHPRIIEIKKIGNTTSINQNETLEYFHSKLYEWQLKSIFNWFSSDENFINQLSKSNHRIKKYIKNGFVTEYWTNQVVKSTGNYLNNKAEGIIESFYENGQLKSKELFSNGIRIRPIEGYYQSGAKQFEYQILIEGMKGKMVNYRPNGTVSFETFYDNGKFSDSDTSDGESYLIYNESGKLEFKGFYKNGKRIRYQKFDETGKLIEDNKNSA